MWDSLFDSYGMVSEDKEELKNSQKLEEVILNFVLLCMFYHLKFISNEIAA